MTHTYQRGNAVEVDDGGIWYAATYCCQLRPGKHVATLLDGTNGGSMRVVNSAQIRPAPPSVWAPPASWAASRDNLTPREYSADPWSDTPPPAPVCDCGGAAAQTPHSHWCSNPLDNKPRPKGLTRKTV